MADKAELKERQRAPLATPNDLGAEATKNISGALNALLADVFALYIKTKNFHWHVSGRHFRTITRYSTSRPSRFSPAPIRSPNACA